MITITSAAELIKFFDHFKSAQRATIVTKTPVKMNKKDVATKTIENPLVDDVFKVQTIEVEFNADYAGKVNDQRLLEGVAQDFVAEGRSWGKHVNGSIVEHQGNFYLHCVEIEKKNDVIYERRNGKKVEKSEFEAFMPPYRGTAKQELEDDVKVRDFKLMNVIGINIANKVRYINV